MSGILNIGTGALLANQSALQTIGNNIANVNTPGYVRKVVDQTSLVTLGAGDGVAGDLEG